MNACIKFGKIVPICSQDIELKRNFGVNQWPYLCYKFAKNDVSSLGLLHIIFRKFIADVWPLIYAKISFMLNILRQN